jgi:hypothetical protein
MVCRYGEFNTVAVLAEVALTILSEESTIHLKNRDHPTALT